MSPEGLPEVLLRARLAVQDQMLVDLWSYVLAELPDSLDAAEDMAARSLRNLDASLDAAGEGGTALQAAADAWMGTLWSLIKADLADLEGPTDIQPTAYGRRLSEQQRRARGTSPEAPSADDSGEAPDR